MLELLMEVWSRAQAELRSSVGESAFEAWLQGLRPLTLERGICYLEAKSKLVRERVERLYRGVLEERLSAELGTKIAVAIVPAPESLVPDGIEVGPARPVVDASNKTAYLVLRTLAEGKPLPARLFFFHGPAGAGKTFLLRWWMARAEQRPRQFTGAGLIKAFQACLRDDRLPQLRAELREDVALVLDEMHRISGQTRLQRELLAALQERADSPHPVLIASRWHPREIWRLDASLASYLVSGMVTRVDPPGPQARLTYLRALDGAPSRNGRAKDIEQLARGVRGSYADVRRAWLVARQGYPANGKYLQLIDPRQVFERVCARVTDALGVSRETLMARSQRRSVSLARQMLCYVCVREGLNGAEVGRFLGGRSRAAISYAMAALERRMAKDPQVRAQVEALL